MNDPPRQEPRWKSARRTLMFVIWLALLLAAWLQHSYQAVVFGACGFIVGQALNRER